MAVVPVSNETHNQRAASAGLALTSLGFAGYSAAKSYGAFSYSFYEDVPMNERVSAGLAGTSLGLLAGSMATTTAYSTRLAVNKNASHEDSTSDAIFTTAWSLGTAAGMLGGASLIAQGLREESPYDIKVNKPVMVGGGAFLAASSAFLLTYGLLGGSETDQKSIQLSAGIDHVGLSGQF